MYRVIKFITIMGLIILYLITSASLSLLLFNRKRRVDVRLMVMQFYARLGLYVMGVDTSFVQTDVLRKKPGLIVSNHMSYLDVMIYAAFYKTRFVTSIEMKNTPVLGWLCEMAACLYVERRSRQNLSHEIKEITDALNEGYSVTIFPESTSTGGDQILRFKSPLYTAAIDAQKWVHCLCLNYLRVNSRAIGLESRDSICWYGKMSFLPHLWKLLGLKSVYAEVSCVSSVWPNKTAKELAGLTQQLIEERFIPIGSMVKSNLREVDFKSKLVTS